MKKGRFSVPFVLFFFFVLFGLYQCGQISFCEIVYGHPDGVQHDRLTEQHPQDVYPINRLSAEQKPYQRQTEGVYQHGRKRREKGIFDFRGYQSRDKGAERAENKVGPPPYAHKIGQETADCQSRHRKRKQGWQNGHGFGNAELDCAEAHKLKNIDERQVNAGYERVVTNVFCDVQLHNAVNSELFFVVCQLNT